MIKTRIGAALGLAGALALTATAPSVAAPGSGALRAATVNPVTQVRHGGGWQGGGWHGGGGWHHGGWHHGGWGGGWVPGAILGGLALGAVAAASSPYWYGGPSYDYGYYPSYGYGYAPYGYGYRGYGYRPYYPGW